MHFWRSGSLILVNIPGDRKLTPAPPLFMKRGGEKDKNAENNN